MEKDLNVSSTELKKNKNLTMPWRYIKVEYIHKIKTQKIYKDIEKAVYYMAFQGNAMDKLKTDKLQRNRSDKEEEWKNKDQVEMLCHLRDTNSLLLSCHLEIGPKPVDDLHSKFRRVLKSLDVGDKWYYQQDNELYTSAGMLSIYRAVLSVDKTKN
jgi:hypothetical protein